MANQMSNLSQSPVDLEKPSEIDSIEHDQVILNNIGKLLCQHKDTVECSSNFSIQKIYDLMSESISSGSALEKQDAVQSEGHAIGIDVSGDNPSSILQSPGSDFTIDNDSTTKTNIDNDASSSLSDAAGSSQTATNIDIDGKQRDSVKKSSKITGKKKKTDDVSANGNRTRADFLSADSDREDVISLSKKFETEISLLTQYLAEIKVSDFKKANVATISNFISNLQGCHMDLLYSVIKINSIIDSKNAEIISLHQQLVEKSNSSNHTCSIGVTREPPNELLGAKNPNNLSLDKSSTGNPLSESSDSLSTIQSGQGKSDSTTNDNPSISNIGPRLADKKLLSDQQFSQHVLSDEFDWEEFNWDKGEWLKVEKKIRKPKALSYSDVTKIPIENLSKPKISKGANVNTNSSQEQVLLLDAKEVKGEKMLNSQFLEKRKKIKDLVNAHPSKSSIANISRTNSGGILMTFPSSKDLENTKTILDNASSEIELSSRIPKKALPKVLISNIDLAIPDSKIINVLLEKNEFLKKEHDRKGSLFELVFTKKDNSNSTQKAVVRCSPNIRSLIMKIGFVRIDCDTCPCEDHLFIFQCNHCSSLGHSTKRCPNKSASNLRCCFCASKGVHSSSDCPHKRYPDKHAWINCLDSTDPRVRDEGITHAANSKTCPIYLRELSKLAVRTNYGSDIVYV